jgi:micrococcal nuclease
VLAIHDGDTCYVDWDLGAGIWKRNERIRFTGINAPELSTPDGSGLAARDFLATILPLNAPVILQTLPATKAPYAPDKQENYGRYLGTFLVPQADHSVLNVNAEMVRTGHAVPYPSGKASGAGGSVPPQIGSEDRT